MTIVSMDPAVLVVRDGAALAQIVRLRLSHEGAPVAAPLFLSPVMLSYQGERA